MHYFRNKADYDKHREEALRGETPGVSHFFREPGAFPCVGIEDSVEIGKGRVNVYLVDFVYCREPGDAGAGRQ